MVSKKCLTLFHIFMLSLHCHNPHPVLSFCMTLCSSDYRFNDLMTIIPMTSHEHDDISNHLRLNCLFHRLFKLPKKKTLKHCKMAHIFPAPLSCSLSCWKIVALWFKFHLHLSPWFIDNVLICHCPRITNSLHWWYVRMLWGLILSKVRCSFSSHFQTWVDTLRIWSNEAANHRYHIIHVTPRTSRVNSVAHRVSWWRIR